MTLLSITRSYAPAPPVLGYVAWYDASDLSTIIHAAGVVSQWNDKSAAAGNVSQATVGSRPLTGGSINGLNALTFDGTDDWLGGTRPVTGQPFTWFAVGRCTETGATQRNIIGTYNGGAGNVTLDRKTTNLVEIYAGAGLVVGGSIVWGASKPHVVSVVINGASSLIAIDGRPATSGNAGANAPGTPSWFIGTNQGSTESWKGTIGEVIVYSTALSNVSRLAVEQYLIQKWLY